MPAVADRFAREWWGVCPGPVGAEGLAGRVTLRLLVVASPVGRRRHRRSEGMAVPRLTSRDTACTCAVSRRRGPRACGWPRVTAALCCRGVLGQDLSGRSCRAAAGSVLREQPESRANHTALARLSSATLSSARSPGLNVLLTIETDRLPAGTVTPGVRNLAVQPPSRARVRGGESRAGHGVPPGEQPRAAGPDEVLRKWLWPRLRK